MNNTHQTVHFFMGTNAPEGFCSLYDELTVPKPGYRRFLIKGGAGTGKSSLMKKAAEIFKNNEHFTEMIHCSSDYNSLDGVIFGDGRCSIVDSTPPHVIEPTYPGAFESVINLISAFDEAKLEKRLPEIVALQEQNNALHKKCRSYLACANILISQNKSTASAYTDFLKLCSFSYRTAKKYFKKLPKCGEKRCRLLSAVTSKGMLCYESSVSALCENIIAFRDDYSASSHVFMDIICDEAVKSGYIVYACYSPFAPKEYIDHIIIPELSLAFVTKNKMYPFKTLTLTKTIHYTRFTNQTMLKNRKAQLAFNRKAADELIASATDCLKAAKANHDNLEKQYTDAVDFQIVNELTDEVISRIRMRYINIL